MMMKFIQSPTVPLFHKWLLTSLLTSLFSHTAVADSVEIPLQDPKAWIALEYSNIPANTVTHSPDGLTLAIHQSASPLIHQLTSTRLVNKVHIQARVIGQLNLDTNKQQGEAGNDDFTLRLGFVAAGEKRLAGWQKPFAAKWVKQLFALAPADSGIDQILFLNVPEDARISGTNREHPASDLLHEYILAPASKEGIIDIRHTFDTPIETVALWISSDGDDTHSQYKIIIESIRLTN